jgi:hypothetical protein
VNAGSNDRPNVRLSPALQAIVATATDQGDRSKAIRALMLIGAAHVGIDITDVRREIARLALEDVHPAVAQALTNLLEERPPVVLPLSASFPSAPIDDDADPFAVGIEV